MRCALADRVAGDNGLSWAAEVFQMVVEGLSNIRRHTHAACAGIELARQDDELDRTALTNRELRDPARVHHLSEFGRRAIDGRGTHTRYPRLDRDGKFAQGLPASQRLSSSGRNGARRLEQMPSVISHHSCKSSTSRGP